MKKIDILNIYMIQILKKGKITKKQFRKYCSTFTIDQLTNILQKKIEFTEKNGIKIKKYFYIAYINEKKSLLENLHEMSCHRGIATLYKLILEQNFIWYNIFKDVKNYINICPSCIEVHKNNLKKLW